jgi:hypothetical protein
MSSILKNVFTTEEVKEIKDQINFMVNTKHVEMENQEVFDPEPMVQYSYLNQGRRDTYDIRFSPRVVQKITKIANELLDDGLESVSLTGVQYTEYSGDMKGNPSLGIHFDGGKDCDMILDYQLESNVSWGIGIDEEVYTLEDNELLLLNPVTKIHYRPKKKFHSGDLTRMIFFKFASGNGNFVSPSISEEKMKRIEYIFNDYYSKESN